MRLSSDGPLVVELLFGIIEILHRVDDIAVEGHVEIVVDLLWSSPFLVWKVELVILQTLG